MGRHKRKAQWSLLLCYSVRRCFCHGCATCGLEPGLGVLVDIRICVSEKWRARLLLDGFFRRIATRLWCFAWLCLKIASLWEMSPLPHYSGDVSELFMLFSYTLLHGDFSSPCYGYNTLASFLSGFSFLPFLLKKKRNSVYFPKEFEELLRTLFSLLLVGLLFVCPYDTFFCSSFFSRKEL